MNYEFREGSPEDTGPPRIFPADWPIVRLADAADKVSVGIASAATFAYRSAGVPLLRNQNIKRGAIDDTDLLYVSDEYDRAFASKRLKANDLLTTRTGYPGITSVVPERYENAQSFTTLITRPKSEVVCSEYLCQYINSELGQRFFEQAQIGGAQKNVNAGTLRKMPVPLPALSEQRSIALVLDALDRLVEGLGAALNKKRGLKHAVMQQLLTSRRRLSGFAGSWNTAKLGMLGRFMKGSGVKRDESASGDLPCVRYGELYTLHDDYIRAFGSWISESVARTAVQVRCGDILFAGSGETREDIGKCAALVRPQEAYAGGDIVIFRPYEADPLFMGYYLNTPPIRAQKASLGQGDAVVHISATALSNIDVCIPSTSEQSAIGQVLSDFDTDIDHLRERLKKVRTLKQAMMQQLLTGRIRLI